MPLEKKHFFLGLNTDDEDRLLQDGEYRYALNIRCGNTDGDDVGAITTTNGNTLVTYTLPGGDNKVIGAFEDKKGRRAIYFLWNSNNRHQILEYEYRNSTINLILEQSVLNFQRDKKIWHINLIDDNILYWTDNFNEPRKLNISRAKSPSVFFVTDAEALLGTTNMVKFDIENHGLSVGDQLLGAGFNTPAYNSVLIVIYVTQNSFKTSTPFSISEKGTLYMQNTTEEGYGAPFKEQSINQIQEPPPCSPIAKYDSDPSKKINNLRGQLYQFKYRYSYKDKEKSTWSPISKLPLPIGQEYEKQVGIFPVHENNVIKLTLERGDFMVEDIEIACRAGNLGDFFLIETISMEDKLQKTLEYEFFNDGIYNSIDLNESNRLFDRVPRQSACQELIGGNRLVHSNFLEGYDKVDINVDIEPEYSDKTLNHGINIFDITILGSKEIQYTITNNGGNPFPLSVNTVFNLTISVSPSLGFFQYMVNSELGDDSEDIIDRFIDQINNDNNNVYFVATKISSTEFSILSTKNIASGARVDPVTATIRGLKRGAWHEWGIVYYDFALRSGAVNKDESTRKYIDFYADTPGYRGAASIKFKINHAPPLWAKKYQLVYTKNQSISRFIQFTAGTVDLNYTTPNGDARISISVGNMIISYETNNEDSILSYSFTKGDRIRFIDTASGSPFEQAVDVGILDYDSGLVIIPKTLSIAPSINCLFEIYTPKKDIEEKFYFEIGECYDIINPGTEERQHQGNFQDQAPIYVITPAQTMSQAVTMAGLGSGSSFGIALFTLSDNKMTNFIDNEEIVIGTEITLSGAGVYDGTWTVIKTRSTSTSSVANSYVKLDTGNLGSPGQQSVIMTFTIPATQGGGPAIIDLAGEGDVYYKERGLGSPIGSKKRYVEDFNYSDFYDSKDISIGRVNVFDENFREIRRPATAYVSEILIPDTNVNGLNSFYGFSYPELPVRAKDYDKRWGSIQKLYSENKSLHLFQELKVGRALVGESVIFDQTGVPTINKSNEILSDIIYYSGEWGIGQEPGSFAVYGRDKYFTDISRGSVLRLGPQGIIEISDIKMHNHFTDVFKNTTKGVDNPLLVGQYDRKFNEYILMYQLEVKETICPGKAHKLVTDGGETHTVGQQLQTAHGFIHGLIDLFEITGIDVGYSCANALQNIDYAEIVYFNRLKGEEITQAVPITGVSGDNVNIRLIAMSALKDGDDVIIKFGKNTITSQDIIATYNSGQGIEFLTFSTEDIDLIKYLGIMVLKVSFYNKSTNQILNTDLQIISFINNNNAVKIALSGGMNMDSGDEVRILETKLIVTPIEKYETIAFNSTDNRWKTFYSYTPEMMVKADSDIITFKDGQLYTHNDNSLQNNFFDIQFTSVLEWIANSDFSARKIWLSVVQEANKIWSIPKITNQLGQKTNLIEGDFENIEGDFYAEILKDENTPVTNPLIEGEDMRSHELKLKMEYSETDFSKIIAAGVLSESSERTNK